MVDEVVGRAGRLGQPFEIEGGLFIVGEVPFHVGVVQPFDDVGDEDGHGVGDVEALGEAVHGNLDGGVAHGFGLIGETGEFGAEEEGGLAVDGQVFEEDTVFGGQGGHEGVAGFVQLVGAAFHVAGFAFVVVEAEPLVGAHGDGAVGGELVLILNEHIQWAFCLKCGQIMPLCSIQK